MTCGSGLPTATACPKPADPFAEGVRAFDAGKWAEAAQHFRDAASRQPKDPAPKHNLGVALWRLNDTDGARGSFEEALSLAPTFKPTLLQLAALDRATDHLAEEVSLLEKATASGPLAHDVALLTELATAYRLQKDFPRAEALCRRVLSRDKDDVGALEVLARIHLDRGETGLAAFVTAKAAKLAPEDARVHNDLGLIALRLGKTRVALAELQKSVELDPEFVPGYLNLGALALRYRDYTSAAGALSKAATLRPKDASVQLAYAWALDGARGSDPAQALRAGAAFEAVLALQPGSTEALCGAAWSYAANAEGWSKAKSLLARCKEAEATEPKERARIDAKLQAISLAEQAPPEARAPGRGIGGAGISGGAGKEEAPAAPAANDAPGATDAPAGAEAGPEPAPPALKSQGSQGGGHDAAP